MGVKLQVKLIKFKGIILADIYSFLIHIFNVNKQVNKKTHKLNLKFLTL